MTNRAWDGAEQQIISALGTSPKPGVLVEFRARPTPNGRGRDAIYNPEFGGLRDRSDVDW